jgi:hypothetical protein
MTSINSKDSKEPEQVGDSKQVDPYHKILDTLLVIRDLREEFRTYSAYNIKNLISAKMKAKKSEPKPLQRLYDLEKMIGEIRDTLVLAKIRYDKEKKENEENEEKEENII